MLQTPQHKDIIEDDNIDEKSVAVLCCLQKVNGFLWFLQIE